MQGFQEHSEFKSSVLFSRAALCRKATLTKAASGLPAALTHMLRIWIKCHWNSHWDDCSLCSPPLRIYSSKHRAVFQWASPYRHSNIEIRLHSEYLQVPSLKQQNLPLVHPQKKKWVPEIQCCFWDFRCQAEKFKHPGGRVKRTAVPLPQHFSYPADLHILTPICNTHKWENTKCSQTLSNAISWESRRHSFRTRLGAWAESLPHLVVPSSIQHSQTHLCHLLSGPCPGHFWLYQTWMSAVSLRGPYSIGKGNYFHFLEIKKINIQD